MTDALQIEGLGEVEEIIETPAEEVATPTETQEEVTAEETVTERKLAGKFKTQEELEKAYLEAQSTLGKTTTELDNLSKLKGLVDLMDEDPSLAKKFAYVIENPQIELKPPVEKETVLKVPEGYNEFDAYQTPGSESYQYREAREAQQKKEWLAEAYQTFQRDVAEQQARQRQMEVETRFREKAGLDPDGMKEFGNKLKSLQESDPVEFLLLMQKAMNLKSANANLETAANQSIANQIKRTSELPETLANVESIQEEEKSEDEKIIDHMMKVGNSNIFV